MIFILQIALTVWAWRRGWNALALFPFGVVIVIGVLAGLASGTGSGFDLGFLIIFDLMHIATLVFMAVRGRHPSPVTSQDSISTATLTGEHSSN